MAVGDPVNGTLAIDASFIPAAGVTVLITCLGEASNTGGMCNNTNFWNILISNAYYNGRVAIFVTNSAPLTQRSVGSGSYTGIQVA